jgi:hypothetical protein
MISMVRKKEDDVVVIKKTLIKYMGTRNEI